MKTAETFTYTLNSRPSCWPKCVCMYVCMYVCPGLRGSTVRHMGPWQPLNFQQRLTVYRCIAISIWG